MIQFSLFVTRDKFYFFFFFYRVTVSALASSSALSITIVRVHVRDAMRRDEAMKLQSWNWLSSVEGEWQKKFTSQWVTMSRCVFSRFPKRSHLVSISVIMTGTEASKPSGRQKTLPALRDSFTAHCTILINSVRSASSLAQSFSV